MKSPCDVLHPQFIMNGKRQPVFVILPYREYQQLLEDSEDEWCSRLAREAIEAGGESIPLDEYYEKRFGKGRTNVRGKTRAASESGTLRTKK